MGAKKRASRPPRFEPLEGRPLQSGILVALQAPVATPSIAQISAIAASHARSTAAGAVAAQAGAAGDQSGLANSSAPNGPNAGVPLPVAPLLGQGTPTRAELAREKFVAHFAGPMQTLPARFTDQSKILYLRGLGGSSPQFFLHGDYGMGIVFPAGFDPKNPGGTYNAATNPGGVPPVTGFAFLDDKNNNSGGTVGLDLAADPTSFDGKGRPTRMFFTSDPNIYSGIFFVSQSTGVVTITYGKNTASARFAGRLYTTGLTSPFQNVDQYAQHSG